MAEEFTDDLGNTTIIATAIASLADEAYTDEKRITSSGIVSANSTINTDNETFVGQLRWHQPMTPVINIASLTDSTDGVVTNYSSDFLNYVKTVRTSGARKINVVDVITQEDGLAKFGRDFAHFRAQDEHNAVVSILKSVAISEAIRGCATTGAGVGLGGQDFDNDPTDMQYGFYVDLGASPLVSTTGTGAGRIQELIEAIGMAWKDYEPEYAYMVTNPELMAGLRSSNLIDTDRVTDGNIDFETILDGKLRLVKSRANASFSSAELTKLNTGAGVDIVGTKTSFIVLPGAIAFEGVNIPKPVGIDNDEAAYHGGGTTEVWYRWGYVAHPVGYDWAGPTNAFPSDLDYQKLTETTAKALSAITDADASTPYFNRKAASALTLGILPIFHG